MLAQPGQQRVRIRFQAFEGHGCAEWESAVAG